MNDIINIHIHTITSRHACNTLHEMASSITERRVRVFGCNDHAPNMPESCDAFYFTNFKVIPRDLYSLHLLMESELNIVDYEGHVDPSPFYLEKLDYTITSLHEPCYDSSIVARNMAAYLRAVENPRIDITGRSDDGRFPCDYDTTAATAKEHHTLLEANSSFLHLRNPRPGARKNCEKMLELCRQHQIPIAIDSDVHTSNSTGNHRLAHAMLEELVFPKELIVNTSIEKLAPYIPVLSTYISGE